ncbi:MAG: DUF5057 domain-containing protein [Lachnospiraceae bacterium]|nr:DUF5057 domain-containing protein [Lachnospiraceae bacterium]
MPAKQADEVQADEVQVISLIEHRYTLQEGIRIMLKMRRNRFSLAFISLTLIFALLVSLFVGVGVIWKTDDIDDAAAASDRIFKNGLFTIPASNLSSPKGAEDNPFVVLEIVPNVNMAQFGYLVSGQEPVDLGKLAGKIAANPDDAVWTAYKDKLQEYLQVTAKTVAKPAIEFNSLITDENEFGYQIGEDTQVLTGKKDEFIWAENSGTQNQYGTFTKDEAGAYALVEKKSFDATGKYIVRKNTDNSAVSDSISIADVNPGETQYDSIDLARASISHYADADTIKTNGDKQVYVKVTEGTGTYSTKKFVKTADLDGQYSLNHKFVGKDDSGNYLGNTVFLTGKEYYFATENNLALHDHNGNSVLSADHGTGDATFNFYGDFVVFRLKKSSDKNKDTYDVLAAADSIRTNLWNAGDSGYVYYNKYYYGVETSDTGAYSMTSYLGNISTLVYAGKLDFIKDSRSADMNPLDDPQVVTNLGIQCDVIDHNGQTYRLGRKAESTSAEYGSARDLKIYSEDKWNYKYDDNYVYVRDPEYGGRYYKYAYYAGNKYYDFKYDPDPVKKGEKNGRCYYHVIFVYKPDGSGRYVVDSNNSKTVNTVIVSNVNAGMTYYRQPKKDPDEDSWKFKGAGLGEYLSETYTVPQFINVPYGEYSLSNVYDEVPVYGEDAEDSSVLFSKEYDRYDIIAIDNETIHYSYDIIPVEEAGNAASTTILAKYDWNGMNYAESVRVDSEHNESTYNIPALSGTYSAEDRQFRSEDKSEIITPDDINGVLKEQSYSKGYPGSYSGKDLFKKFALGLGYKNNDYKNGEDVDSFTFLKWCTDPYGINELSDSEKIMKDTELYAKWLITYPSDLITTESGESGEEALRWEGYTLKFEKNAGDDIVANMPGDSENNTITGINRNAYIISPDAVPVRQDMEFTGWYFDAACTRKAVFPLQVTEDMVTDRVLTLYAGWKALGSVRFTVSFDSNLGTLSGSTSSYSLENFTESLGDIAVTGRRYYTAGGADVRNEIVVNEPVCKKNGSDSGYEFAGWYRDIECTVPFEFNQTYLEEIEKIYKESHPDYTEVPVHLYARWEKSSSNTKYSITFNANIPSAAVAKTVGGLGDHSTSYKVGEVQRTLMIRNGKASLAYGETLPAGLRPTLTLEGNITEKINSYNVKVITATPREFDGGKNLALIRRADLIVINETCETGSDSICGKLWDECHKNTGLGKITDKYTYTKADGSTVETQIDKFWKNDLTWTATTQILSRITGFYFDSSKNRVSVNTCPVLYDFRICLNAVYSDDPNVYKSSVTFTYKDANGETGTVTSNGINTNITKLYVLTQYANPVTLSNAYLSGDYTKKIDGSPEGTRISSTGDDYRFDTSDGADLYWGAETLTPFNVINKSDWEDTSYLGRKSMVQKTLGIDGNIFDGTARVRNRMFVYGSDGTYNFVTRFHTSISLNETSRKDVDSALNKGETEEIRTDDVFYYILHSDSLYKNLDRDMSVLELQPGTYRHSEEYWFWFISQYAPNINGKITVRSMSSTEFDTNITDLNSNYDVIYIGVDQTGMLSDLMPKKEGESLPYSYAHTGKIINDVMGTKWGAFNKVLDPSTGRLSDDDATTTAAFSGNDLSFVKYKEIAEFVRAGYPVILSKDIFRYPGDITKTDINTARIDTASWMYKLIDELVQDSKKSKPVYHTYRENSFENNGTFIEALNNKRFKLEIISQPKEYSEEGTDSKKYINYPDLNATALVYNIRINANHTGSKYKLKIYVDTNADGKYDGKTELLDSVHITDITDSKNIRNVKDDALTAGRIFKVQRDISGLIGAISWKLEIIELDDSGGEKLIRDEALGLCAVKAAEKEDIYVLQVTTDKGTWFNYWNNKYTGNTVLFATDDEIKQAKNHNGVEISYANKETYFLNTFYNYRGKAYWYDDAATRLERNAGKFYYYISQLQEYNVHFMRVDVNQLADIAKAELEYQTALENGNEAEIAAKNSARKPVGKALRNGASETTELYWDDLNMLILGYGDNYNDIANNDSIKLIKDFILEGKSVLFTHDTTSYINYYDPLKFNTIAIKSKKPDGSDLYELGGQWYGININTAFRDFLGMDRYGVTINRGYLKESDASVYSDEKLFTGSGAKSVSETAGEALSGANISSEDRDSAFAPVSDFDRININNAGLYKLSYDIPFKTGKTIKIKDSSGNYTYENLAYTDRKIVNIDTGSAPRRVEDYNWTNYIYYTYDAGINDFVQHGRDVDGRVVDDITDGAYYYYDMNVYPSADPTGNKRILTQGMTNRSAGINDNLYSQVAKKNNDGQIVKYPYEIKDIIPVATTHSQYYQINPENEDIVVWYSLAGDDDGDQAAYFGGQGTTYLDGINNYYIFNNKNVTYTGLGHSGDFTDKFDYEIKLFVNTFVASYRAKAEAAVPEIKNRDKSADGDTIYLYVDYDASIPKEKKAEDGEGNVVRVFNENSAVPVGDEISEKQFTSEEKAAAAAMGISLPDSYFTKRIFFTLENTSVIVNKVMSVHYYYVDGSGTRYDTPLALDTYLVPATEAEKADPVKADNLSSSEVPFKYRNKTVNVASAAKVESAKEYYVDIPVSDSYYKVKFGLDEFALDKNSTFTIQIDVVMRYGRNLSKTEPLVGSKKIVIMRRGMFKLD